MRKITVGCSNDVCYISDKDKFVPWRSEMADFKDMEGLFSKEMAIRSAELKQTNKQTNKQTRKMDLSTGKWPS